MATLNEQERRFLEQPFVGEVTTLRPDGSPHTTVVWVDPDTDVVSFNTAVRTSRKGCTVALFQRICCASHGTSLCQ